MTTPPLLSSSPRRWFVLVGAAAVLSGAITQAQQPLSVPDVEIAPRVIADRGDSNSRPRAAYNNGRWLVVWNNRKTQGLPNASVQAALFDATGAPLSPFALQLTPPELFPFRTEEVSVAPLGDGFMVVWTLINTYDEAYAAQIVGFRVDLNGRPTEGVRILSDPIAISRFPQLTSAGDRCLLVWTDDIQKDGTLEVKGRVLPAEGNLTGNPIITVSPAGVAQDRAAVAFAGGVFLATWTSIGNGIPRGIYGAVVGLNGDAHSPFLIASSGEDYNPRAARLGENFLVIWHDFSRDFGSGVGEFGDVKATRVNPTGQVLDTPALILRDNPTNEPVLFSSVSGSEASALVTWTEDDVDTAASRVVARRVLPNGTIEVPPGGPPATEAHQIFDAVSSPGPDSWMLAHTRDAAQTNNGQWPSEVYVRLLHADGSPAGDEVRASGSANITQAIAVASLDGGFVAVWQDDRHERQSEWDLYARRFKADGSPIDAVPFVVAESLEDQASPAVASVGDTWAVVWRTDGPDYSAIQGRIMKGAAPLSNVFLLEQRTTDKFPKAPEIAAGPGGFFAVWVGSDPGLFADPFEDIRGSGISLTGAVAQPGGFAISAVADADQGAPEVASTGTSYLVVWRRDSGIVSGNAILARWFESAVPPPEGTSPVFQIANDSSPRAPDVASHESHYLVAWRSGRQVENILATRVNGPEQLSPVQIIGPTRSSLKEPTVAGFSDGWVVAWFAGGSLEAAQVHDGADVTVGQWFEVRPLLPGESPARDTLTAASSSDRVFFGMVDATLQAVEATLVFPGRIVPVLPVARDALGHLRIAAPADPYFPLVPEKVEVSANGIDWHGLTSLPAGSWSMQPDGSLEIVPASPLLLARLRATLTAP